LICDTCKKLIFQNGRRECAALRTKGLRGKPESLPVWGPECSAYTDDPEWWDKYLAAVEKYKKLKGAV